MKHLISLKLFILFATFNLFNLNANYTSDQYVQAFRAAIRLNYLYFPSQKINVKNNAEREIHNNINNLIVNGINLMKSNSEKHDPFFSPTHVAITTTRLQEYARARKSSPGEERILIRTEFIEQFPILISFFSRFIDTSVQDKQPFIDTINKFVEIFGTNQNSVLTGNSNA